MVIQPKYGEILDFVQAKMTCSAHSLDHVFRVYKLCQDIAAEERHVDYDVLLPAALLHDIARVDESDDTNACTDHALLGSKIAGDFLEKIGYPPDRIAQIQHCIASHRYRSGYPPQTAEAKILFDADKLDAIGAVGIARTFMLAGQHKQRLVLEASLEAYVTSNTAANGRIKDLSLHTPCSEYALKLKNIPERLFTVTAQRLGVERAALMNLFFAKLQEELT